MIVYDLTCAVGHRFESWFQSAAAFDEQCEGGTVACPYCGNREIGKAPMAPRVFRGFSGAPPSESEAAEKGQNAGGSEPAESSSGPPAALLEMLRQLRRHVESNCDYVGGAFPEHARRIFYSETAPRGIYGEASVEEAEALKDEGIETQRIPWLPHRNG